jgi:DNA-binding NarL/FixJ family response regulator
MTPIRVVTAGLPPLQADVVRRILAAEPDVSVVGAVNSATGLTRMGGPHTTDVIVIWAQATDLVSAAVGILVKHPSLSVVVLAGNGDALVEARVISGSEHSWSGGLIEAVRRAAERGRSQNGDRGKEQ